MAQDWAGRRKRRGSGWGELGTTHCPSSDVLCDLSLSKAKRGQKEGGGKNERRKEREGDGRREKRKEEK